MCIHKLYELNFAYTRLPATTLSFQLSVYTSTGNCIQCTNHNLSNAHNNPIPNIMAALLSLGAAIPHSCCWLLFGSTDRSSVGAPCMSSHCWQVQTGIGPSPATDLAGSHRPNSPSIISSLGWMDTSVTPAWAVSCYKNALRRSNRAEDNADLCLLWFSAVRHFRIWINANFLLLFGMAVGWNTGQQDICRTVTAQWHLWHGIQEPCVTSQATTGQQTGNYISSQVHH